MRIISVAALREFWSREGRQDAEQPLRAWVQAIKGTEWSNVNHLKNKFGSASIIGDGRVVFNIGGNKYRLIVKFKFDFQIGYIRFVGTHEEYDKVDAKSI
ncbi:MAG: type II toxin-antitoxin system HigB family toxin [Imperialibacter sp.]|jgi:mRNA interferase HigB|uniref:type II toxin-antitoxin system HigB family toxin n=1 Tax=Imperialibacter sp. TaxID=2038411 RepID=UPI0032EEE703